MSNVKPPKNKFENTVYEDDNPETWLHSIPGGLTVSAGVILLATIVFSLLYLISPSTRASSGFIAYVGVNTVALIIGAGVLMLSMVIAARITGGIDFGYIGSALWKSLVVILIYSILIHFISGYGLFSLIVGLIALVACFMSIFRIDHFEACLLAIVNVFLLMALNIARMAMLLN